MKLSNVKISHKLTGAFALVLAVIGALGGAVLIQIDTLMTTDEAVSRGHRTLETLSDIQRSVDRQESNTRAYVTVQNPDYLTNIERYAKEFDEQLGTLRRELEGIPGADGRIDRLQEAVNAYRAEIVEKETRLASDPATLGQAVAIIRSGAAARYMGAVNTAFADIRERQVARIETADKSQEAAFETARIALGVGVVAALLVSVLSGWVLTRALSTPIALMIGYMRRVMAGETAFEIPCAARKDEFGQMGLAMIAFRDAAIEKSRLEGEGVAQRAAAEAERTRNQGVTDAAAREQAIVVQALGEGLDHLTRGDLTYSLNQPFPGDYQKLKDDFNAAIGQLKEAMSVVVTNVSAIRSGSGEISQAADDLSRRTEQQAASLEETAAALDEITATVNRTAAGARQASETVQAAKGDAETSGNVVREAVSAMGAIEKSAQEISQIIGVIDEIAFQTNLLALNAGVEAARAGDAGRGFAVVASEVRALAQRSAEAAKEIKVLISASTAQVNSGVNLVGQTGEALQRIVGRVAEIDGLVSEIAASAQEQATGLQQVNTAVNQMDQVTQQNAAMVEESTAASHSLSQEAETLAASMSRFRIGESAPTARAAPRPASRPVSQTVTAMKTTGRGGAARRYEPVASEDGWEEF
ncbi:methyl-accepting chemotaxis protein [Brevundimonas sp.]|uniref:methyl-accepting chemotaxis protein n=1 Tax=Brevundimonas sp. TaxID=1871086 RepID=UPI00272F175A|nr:methyl-accepting chemotaxis protein [Brevundimonas sp.]MDP1912906.1 methyl-accepting chemotaxis protein [Brevundimonas sp.]